MRLWIRRSLVALLGGLALFAQAPEPAISRATVTAVPGVDGSLDLFIVVSGARPLFDWGHAAPAALPCEWNVRSLDEASFAGSCAGLFSTQGLKTQGGVAFAPMAAVLHQAGYRTVEISVNSPDWTDPAPAQAGWAIHHDESITMYAAVSRSLSDLPPPLAILLDRWHTPPTEPPPLLFALLLVLVLPSGVALIIRSRSGPRTPVIALHWLQTGTWILWLFVLPPSQILALLSRLPEGSGARLPLGVLLLALPPVAANTLSFLLLARGPHAKAPGRLGFLRRPLLLETGLALLFCTAPIAVAQDLQGVRSPLSAVALVLVAAMTVLLLAVFGGTRDLSALENGDLRDRVLQMAKQAGAQVKGIFVIHNRLPHEANAFADVRGRRVLLSADFLARLPRREVDALLAHEIGHLRSRLAVRVTKVYEAYAVAYFMTWLAKPILAGAAAYAEPVLLFSTILGLVAVAAMSRSREYAADAASARITNDRCALMAGLGRVAAMHETPLAWGPMAGLILSHPSYRNRALRLANQAGMAEWRALQILETPDSLYGPSAGVRSPDLAARYPTASRYPGGEPCFSATAKAGHAASSAWLMRAAVLSPLLALAYAISRFAGGGWIGTGIFAITLGPVWMSTALLLRWWHTRFLRKMACRIAAKLPAGGPGEMVGLWPGEDTGAVQGFWAWDIGRVTFSGDRWMYEGERARFSIPRDQIGPVEIVATPGTGFRLTSLGVPWGAGVFSVRPIAGGSRKHVQRLLDRWMESATQPGGSLPPGAANAYPDPAIGSAGATSASGISLLAQAVMLWLLAAAALGFLPDFALSRVAVWAAPLLYLAASLPQIMRRRSAPSTAPAKPGESKAEQLKQQESIALAANRLFLAARRNPDWQAAEASFAEGCEQCARLLQINPHHLLGLKIWASGLLLHAARKPRQEAIRLYREAEEKWAGALEISRYDPTLITALAHAQLRRATLDGDGTSGQLLKEARANLENALCLCPSSDYALVLRAQALAELSKRHPGPRTDQALADALESFEAAAAGAKDPSRVLRGQAVIRLAQGIRASGEASVLLFRQAKERFLAAESREPGAGAYSAACACARLGETDECRHWLEKSGEPGVKISPDELALSPHFESVRWTDWFQALVHAHDTDPASYSEAGAVSTNDTSLTSP